MKTFIKATTIIVMAMTMAGPAVAGQRGGGASSGYFGGGAATTERVFREHGPRISAETRATIDRGRDAARKWAKQQAAETAGVLAGKALGMGRQAGWVGVGIQLLTPTVAE